VREGGKGGLELVPVVSCSGERCDRGCKCSGKGCESGPTNRGLGQPPASEGAGSRLRGPGRHIPGLTSPVRQIAAGFQGVGVIPLATYARKPPMSSFQAGALAAYVDYGFAPCPGDEGGVELKCRPEVEARIVAMTFTHDAVARISSLRCPLTQVFGTLTPPVQQQTITSVARLTGTPTIAVDGLGHFGPMEQPWTIAGVIGRNVLGQQSATTTDEAN
jgi:pimeloyl-ACP methyl ester carboxylesterase